MTAESQNVHIGQVWSVRDHRRDTRRCAEVVATTEWVNDATAAGARVSVVNVDTGRRSHMLASTLRAYWTLEREAPADE